MLGIAFGTRPEWIKILPVVKELIERVIPFKLIIKNGANLVMIWR